MTITHTKRGAKIFLRELPNEDEIRELNKYGDFRIRHTRTSDGGYDSLIHYSGFMKMTSMECPIGEAFYV